MHTWDLARASGQDDTLDAEKCAVMLAGMQPMDEVLRAERAVRPEGAGAADADRAGPG